MASLLAPKGSTLYIVHAWVGDNHRNPNINNNDNLMPSPTGGSPSAWLPLPLEARYALFKTNCLIFLFFQLLLLLGQRQAIQGINHQG